MTTTTNPFHLWVTSHCYACGREFPARVTQLLRQEEGGSLTIEEEEELNAYQEHVACYE
jgi:hypothetical protein